MKKNEYPARVLLVDDTPKNLQLLGNILKEYEYKIYAANNGKQALETAQETLPDIILLDVMMPEMDGIETTRHI